MHAFLERLTAYSVSAICLERVCQRLPRISRGGRWAGGLRPRCDWFGRQRCASWSSGEWIHVENLEKLVANVGANRDVAGIRRPWYEVANDGDIRVGCVWNQSSVVSAPDRGECTWKPSPAVNHTRKWCLRAAVPKTLTPRRSPSIPMSMWRFEFYATAHGFA